MTIKKIKNLADKYFDQTIGYRRYLHQNPELSFCEFNTSKYIFDQLQKIGLEPFAIADTGVAAIIKGNGDGKTIALRADIDALPIQEENDLSFKSINSGVMHACGHDVHTSSLLGVANILNELKHDFKGNVKLMFQPAEEKVPGGAKSMIEEGILKNPEVSTVFGQHVEPDLEAGIVGFRGGDYMASTDEIILEITGKGGHAAMPWKLNDTVLITSHIIVALQQIVSRNSNSNIPTVLSFGKIETINGAINVIPDKVIVYGTFRTFDENWRNEAKEKIRTITENMAKAMGANAQVTINHGYPVLSNDMIQTKKAKAAAIQFLGESNVVDLDLRMTAEDFSYFSQAKPSVFYRLGTSNKSKGILNKRLHTPNFNIDEDAIKTSIGLMAYLALNELNS